MMPAGLEVRLSGSGQPFLWAHGLLTSMQAEDILDWFGWGDFPPTIKLIRYNARGHGESLASWKAQDYRWQNLAQDLLQLADQLGLHEFIAGGASMGASTALYAALKAPWRVRGLILFSPPTAWQRRCQQAANYRRSAWLAFLLGGKGLAWLAERDLQGSLPGWMGLVQRERVKRTLPLLNRYSRLTLWALLRGAALSDLPSGEQMRALAQKPVLILAWTEDAVHPVETAQELYRLLPNSDLWVAHNEQTFREIPTRMIEFINRL